MASSTEDHNGDRPNSYYQSGPSEVSPLTQAAQARFNEEFDASRRGSSLVDGPPIGVQRTTSQMSQSQTLTPSRGGTLKKRASLKRGNSLRRSSSRRSLGAGSMKSLNLGDRERYDVGDFYSAFHTPVPTRGSPTEVLATRFQDWRRVLKDLISYFREVQKSHEARSKSLLSLSNLASNISGPPGFMKQGGIADATNLLKDFHKKALSESNKAKTIEEEIIQQLTGLRNDLGQKIKEIKSLSGDFKNSCEKESDGTRKAVANLQESLGLVEHDPGSASGKGDPFIVKLNVERQIERQIDEENYLHKAFLNLEHSGRELESIVVGEIQKAYNAYAGILKREADEGYEIVESLRMGPVGIAKDLEWDSFIGSSETLVDPQMPLRKPDQITYPGKDAPAATEVRSGMLERKSKYLKSYTPGWYVLSPTHLHEFKSPDRLSTQAPVMSLYLPEQKLGSHSNQDSSSHKFMLKGRQTGGMHRGHGWVFRAESRDTMLSWFDDIKTLTEKTGAERELFIRRHARSVSQGSMGAISVSSDGAMDEDEADRVPYSAQSSQLEMAPDQEDKPQRPQPGGRFPSDLNTDHHLQMPLSGSSGASSDDREAIAAAAALPGTNIPNDPSTMAGVDAHRLRSESYRDEPYVHPDIDLYATSQPALAPLTAAPEPQLAAESVEVYAAHDARVDPLEPAFEPRPSNKAAKILGEDTDATPPARPLASVAPAVEQPASPVAEQQVAMPPAGPRGGLAPVVTHAPAAHSHGEVATLTPTTPATTMTSLSDASLESTDAVAFGALDATVAAAARPPLSNAESEQTISNLHVPGGFPKKSA